MSWGQEIFRKKYRETMESINTIYENYYDLDSQYQEEMKEKDEEIERLHSIIKEVREYIYNNSFDEERKKIIDELWVNEIKDILDILDKGE